MRDESIKNLIFVILGKARDKDERLRCGGNENGR
jgi:hypothetical protein